MDWRDLLDERNRRQSQGYTGFTLPSYRNFATTSAPQDEEDDGGFFGGIGNAIEGVGKGIGAVGSFFGNMVEDVVETAGDAVGGIKDVVEGEFKRQDLEKNTEKLNALNKERSAFMRDLSEEDFDKPEIKAKLDEYQRKAEAIINEGQQITESKDWKEAQEVDPLKTAAAAGETFLNVATLGVGGIAKNVGKGAIKQGAKVLGKETAEKVSTTLMKGAAKETAEQTAKRTAQAAANRTASGAAKTMGRGAAEGALFGAGYGALQPVADQGEDASWEDIFRGALMGGAFGGAVGTAAPLLDKNVRAGVRQMPGAVREGVGNAAEAAQRYTPTGMAMRSPAVQELDDTMAMLNRQRESLVARGLSENSPAIRSNARAYEIALGEKNRLVREMTQGGYIRIPGGNPIDDANSAADLARRQLDGEDITSATPSSWQDQYVAERVASYSSPQQFIDDTVETIWEQNKKGKGVETMLQRADPNSYDVTGRVTMSNNDPFYQAFYREYGRPPSKKAIRDMVEQRLTGKPGEYRDVLTEDIMSPFEADIYQQLVDREAGLAETIRAGAPDDMFGSFASDLGAPAPVATTTAQQAVPDTLPLQTATEPAEQFTQDLSRPALPQGELPKPPTPAQAKRSFKATGEAKEFVNRQRPGQRPFNLPATSEDLSKVAVRTTEAGKTIPIKNGADYVSKDVMDAVKELQGQSHRFRKISPLTDINTINEQLTREIGGVNSKAGQIIEGIRSKVQEADARVVRFNNEIRKLANRELQNYNFSDEQWGAINRWLNQQTDVNARNKAFQEIVDNYGEDVATRAQAMFNEWSPRMRQAMEAYNRKVEALGYPERKIGDLGEFYWPRVYKQASLKDKATDVAGSILDLKANGLDKTGYNPNTMSGSTTASNMTLPGQGRNFNQAPIGSEFSKPTVGFTGHAKSRTAKSPIQEQVNPLEAATKYLETVNAITANTDAVHEIRGVQQAIKALQKETGDNTITILNDVLDNVANPLLGKTNEIDRSLQKYYAGQKAMEWGGFLSKQLSRSQLLGSVRTVLAQTGQIPLLTAEVGPQNALKGIRMMFSKKFDDLMEQSDFLVSNKFMGNESPFSASTLKRMAEKGERVAGWGMDASAAAMGKAAWSGAYLKAQAQGLTGKALIKEADRVAAKVVGNRAAGLRPSLYESRAAQGLAMYTLDINQMYQATKGYIGEKNYKALGTLLGAAWAYNLLYEGLTGEPLVADPIRAAGDAGGILTSDQYLDSEGNPIGIPERLLRATGRMGGEALAYAPLGNIAGGIYPEQGLRLPFSGDRTLTRSELFGDSAIGRYGPSAPLSAAFENPLYLLGIPGTGQAQRSFQGLQAFGEGESLTPTGRQRFEVEQDFENWLRALLFGQYQTREGREYIEQLSRQQRGESSL